MPSIHAAAGEARRVVLRFPFVLISAVTAAAVGSAMVGRSNSEPLEAAFVAASLGLALFVALALAAERIGSRGLATILGTLGVAGLVALAFAWPHWTEAVSLRRYAQLSIGFHLLVAFLPYLRGGEPHGFWQFNRALFLRFLTAAVHSSVLYVGLAIALLALDKLLGIKVHGNAYLRLWLFVAIVFNTWFFLGGVPNDVGALEQRRDYPRALLVFSRFILIPLVAVHLTILTIYLVRILVSGQWPSNWIGYLVSSVAAVGMLSLLLVHPIREDEGHRWVGRYARWFYVALLPAVGMLLAAIGKRIAQYGVTEDRYFITVLAVWLAGIAMTFIVRRNTDIRWIPITLCAVAFLTLSGPLGAYHVSERSQIARLRAMLEANGVLANGVVTPARGTVGFDARKEISNSVTYLIDVHGPGPVGAVLGEAMPALPRDTVTVERRHRGGAADDAQAVMLALGMPYVSPWENRQTESFNYYVWRPKTRAVSVRGADYHVHLDGGLPVAFEIEGEPWRLERVRSTLELVSPRGTLRFPMDTLITFARAHGGRARDEAEVPRLTAETAGTVATLVPNNYSGTAHGDSVQVNQMTGDLYLTVGRAAGERAGPGLHE